MKIYLAGPWADRSRAHDTALRFEAEGFEITERWWNHVTVGTATTGSLLGYEPSIDEEEELKRQALIDIEAVKEAHLMVVLNFQKSEGKAAEQGIALAFNMPIIGIGQRGSNIFQFLDNYTWVETVDEAIHTAKVYRDLDARLRTPKHVE
jgi:hypothetical protein